MRLLLVVASLALAGCAPEIPDGELACDDELACPEGYTCHRDGRCRRGVEPPVECGARQDVVSIFETPLELPPRAVDVLLVQSAHDLGARTLLRLEAERLVRVLGAGDLDRDLIPDPERAASIHLGVITDDVGSPDGRERPDGCSGERLDGDRGILQTLTSAECEALDAPVLAFDPASDDLEGFLEAIDCRLRVIRDDFGVSCDYEFPSQPFEAALRALTPSSSPLRFQGQPGEGDRSNAGFLRDDAILLVLFLSTVDDCSGPVFSGPACHGTAAIERFADGLLALKADPADLVIASIVGLPLGAEAQNRGTDGRVDWAALLAHPEMSQAVLSDSCNFEVEIEGAAAAGSVQPGTRFVELTRELQARRGNALATTICAAARPCSTGSSPTSPIGSRPPVGSSATSSTW
ncbi:MAG: hypothetical protein KC619_20355 [Myxococcales bacterium]|nr:hypothetical protein [Myxococcales bacterium]